MRLAGLRGIGRHRKGFGLSPGGNVSDRFSAGIFRQPREGGPMYISIGAAILILILLIIFVF
jgi:hypothetical protein